MRENNAKASHHWRQTHAFPCINMTVSTWNALSLGLGAVSAWSEISCPEKPSCPSSLAQAASALPATTGVSFRVHNPGVHREASF